MKTVYGFSRTKMLLTKRRASDDYNVSEEIKEKLKEMFGTDKPQKAVEKIINKVQRRGDDALFDYSQKIDGIKLESLEVSREQVEKARHEVDSRLMTALKLAADRIYSFHMEQKNGIETGVAVMGYGTIMRPLKRVGVYAPGGTASYPSTVLMTALPARVAGVEQVILVTPPGKNGKIPAATLAAADIARVDRIFSIGGAQAIAALAYGTQTVPKVDKICGPGNIFVMLAKKYVFGAVGIDGLQGPSEVVIIADKSAKAKNCAAEILAQAEHDALAEAIFITNSGELATEVKNELEKQLVVLKRKKIAVTALNNNGVIAVVASINEAIELSNLYAPEHLCLDIQRVDKYIEKITNAGCIFTGEEPTVVMGDYVAGPSHALPTGGTARFSSPLNITDFMKYTNVVNTSRESLEQLGDAAAIIARAEGLEAHARVVEQRLEKNNTDNDWKNDRRRY
ncbi:histidinol dehydrogenase [Chloroflexota bacterium]